MKVAVDKAQILLLHPQQARSQDIGHIVYLFLDSKAITEANQDTGRGWGLQGAEVPCGRVYLGMDRAVKPGCCLKGMKLEEERTGCPISGPFLLCILACPAHASVHGARDSACPVLS